MSEDFVVLLKKIMIQEFFYTGEEAEMLIKKHTNIVMQGIMKGNFALRAAVMAMEMAEN